MPAVRSSPRESPTFPNYAYTTALGCAVGMAFEDDYEDRYWIPDFINPLERSQTVAPEDPRPPPLKLKVLKCSKVLGVGQGQVFLVSSNAGHKEEGGHPMNMGTVFALKGMRRKDYRTQGPILLPRHPSLDSVPADRRLRYLEKHHSDINLERKSLVYMEWSPWVAGLIQSFHDSQMLYMAIEYIPGGTLRALLRKAKGGLTLAAANFYFANLVCALEFLEEQEIVHRDLKPENILIGMDGYLVLTDFGTSSRIDDHLCEWQGLGTPYYMAPECRFESEFQPQNNPHALDWWSSGCILFEMVTGKVAFCGVNTIDTQMRTVEGIQWPDTFKLGTHLFDLVGGLLEVDSESRLGTIEPERIQGVKKHPWLAKVNWVKMSKRRYLAPYLPKSIDPADTWHSMALPKQNHVPGLPIVEPPMHIAHDNRYSERPIL